MFTFFKSVVKTFTGVFAGKPATSPILNSQDSCESETPDKAKRVRHYEVPKDPSVPRMYYRNDVVRGEVVGHDRDGVLVKVPNGEVGLVVHAELDWSPKMGKKYFPIGGIHDVMVLNRKSEHRLYLSIKRCKFDDYFEKAKAKYKVGMQILAPIVARRDYGFFVRLMPRVDVFIHKDKLEAFDRFKIGDLVEIRVTGYDMDRLRIQGDMAESPVPYNVEVMDLDEASRCVS